MMNSSSTHLGAPRPSCPALLRAVVMALVLAFAVEGARAQDAPQPVAADGTPMTGAPTIEPAPERFVPAVDGDRIRIVPEDVMTVEENLAYGGGRTIIYYGDRTLEADRLLIDLITLETQAEGNVILRGPKEVIHATSARFNFRHQEGVAFGVDGRYDKLFFKVRQNEDLKGPGFRKISEVESLFRGTQMTTCNFPVPHYHVRAREVIIIDKQKILFRGMTLYLRRYPILYLPWYARTFESSPWHTEVGYGNTVGFFTHISYRYIHELKTPKWDNPQKYETRTRGQLDLSFDYFANVGPGAGLKYEYKVNYGQHRGELEIYGIRDGTSVDIVGGKSGTDKDEDRGQRYVYSHKHNSKFGRTIWQYNVDWVSDPDVYYDVMDRFRTDSIKDGGSLDSQRGRLAERRYRLAATYLRSNWLARIMLDHKERLGRDNYTDFSQPYSDDLDYDFEPDNLTKDTDSDKTRGLAEDRYGVVRDYYSARWATNLIRVWNAPLFWRSQFNAFQGLDAGFNTLDTEDDASVTGIDFYNSLTHRIRFSERYTWTNTLGIGVGMYDRGDNLVDRNRLVDGADSTFVDDQEFADEDTAIVGEAERDINDVDSMTIWADFKSRLNARFTDTLQGNLTYTYRQTLGESLGEFYESLGRIEARDEIYDFPSDRHWIEGYLNHFLLYPNINSYLFAGANLQSGGDIYANESLNYGGIGTKYKNDSKEFAASASVFYQTRQVRDPSDDNAFEQGSVNYRAEMEYTPRHRRWWVKVRGNAEQKLDSDPADNRSNEQRRRYDEEDTRITVTPLIGGQVGPKHIAEFSMTYNSRYGGIDRYGFTIIRDLHDAELSLFLGARNNSSQSGSSSTGDGKSQALPSELEFKASLKVKMPGQAVDVGRSSITTLRDRPSDAYFVE